MPTCKMAQRYAIIDKFNGTFVGRGNTVLVFRKIPHALRMIKTLKNSDVQFHEHRTKDNFVRWDIITSKPTRPRNLGTKIIKFGGKYFTDRGLGVFDVVFDVQCSKTLIGVHEERELSYFESVKLFELLI